MQPGHADRVLDRVGAAVGEEDFVQSIGRQGSDALGRLAPGSVRMLRSHRRELGSLCRDRGDDLGVLMADIDVDELAGEVEEAVAVEVPDVGALTTGNDHRVQGPLSRPGVEDMGAVEIVDALALGRIRGDKGAHADSRLDVDLPRLGA
ncbi:unannotated protein [freshwater metagenome]|uniref:Unannotated protein n=1 Tax=freshwater metagenome TaxID=449393 RepID=A0A6J7C1J3_9ZZZZ